MLRDLHPTRANLKIDEGAITALANLCDGDARVALNALEMSVVGAPADATTLSETDVATAFQRHSFHYDKSA